MSTYTADGPSATGTAEGGSTTEQAKAKVQNTAQQAAGKARGTVRDQVDQRSTQAGEQASTVASDVRSVSQQLREQGKDQPAKLAEQAADRVERVGDYLKRSDGDTILRDIEDFGRRQPWTVVAGGLALGFVASRFLKASSSRRYEERWESSSRLPARRLDVGPVAADPLAPSTVRPGATDLGAESAGTFPPPATDLGAEPAPPRAGGAMPGRPPLPEDPRL